MLPLSQYTRYPGLRRISRTVSSLPDIFVRKLQVDRHIGNEIVVFLFALEGTPQLAGLAQVVVSWDAFEACDITIPLVLVSSFALNSHYVRLAVRREVIWLDRRAQVTDISHPIAFGRVIGVLRCVDRNLMKIDAKTIARGGTISKETSLQDCSGIRVRDENRGEKDLLGSALISHPGTIAVGLKLTCSTSPNSLDGFRVSLIFPNGIRGECFNGTVLVGSNIFTP